MDLIDDFNRASLGANWSTFGPAGEQLAIHGSAQLGGGAVSYSGSYFNAQTFGPNCEAEITQVIAVGANYFGLMLCGTNMGTSTETCYKLSQSGNTLQLFRVNAGTDTQLGSVEFTPQNGDKFKLIVDGDQITIITTRGGTPTTQIDVTDGSPLNQAGNLAIDIFDPNSDDVRLDDLFAGDLTAGGTEYTDADTVYLKITPSATETREQYDASTVVVTITPSGTDEHKQTMVPVAVVDAGGYTDQTGASDNASLLAAVNESAPDTGDYVQSVFSPNNAEIKFRMTGVTDPGVHTGHTIDYYYGKSSDQGDQIDQTITVYRSDGTTVVRQVTHTDVPVGPVQGSFELSEAEAASFDGNDYSTGIVIGLKAHKV